MSAFIAALDSALAVVGEEFILRRVVGTGANVTNVDVTCIGQVSAMSVEQIAAGLLATDLNVIFSPTQINEKQWPGGTVPIPPPFNIDPRIPRQNGADVAIVRGVRRQIALVKPFYVDELCRIEMRVSG